MAQAVEGSFSVCPKCKSGNISGDSFQVEGGSVWQVVSCEDCDFQWNEVYTFFQAETTDLCMPIDEDGNIATEGYLPK